MWQVSHDNRLKYGNMDPRPFAAVGRAALAVTDGVFAEAKPNTAARPVMPFSHRFHVSTAGPFQNDLQQEYYSATSA